MSWILKSLLLLTLLATHSQLFARPYEEVFEGYVRRGNKIFSPQNKLIATINLSAETGRAFEVRQDELFWIDIDQGTLSTRLRIRNLKTNKEELLFDLPGLNFKTSPDGQRIILEFGEGQPIKIFDRKTKTLEIIAKTGEGGRDDGFTLIGWSKDGKKFWFGSGTVDSWTKLALYENGKVTWLPYQGGSMDEAFDSNRGWLVTSDYIFQYEEVGGKKYEASGVQTTLTVYEVLTGKKASLAQAKVNIFRPRWISEDKLEFQVTGKKHLMLTSEIKAKLK